METSLDRTETGNYGLMQVGIGLTHVRFYPPALRSKGDPGAAIRFNHARGRGSGLSVSVPSQACTTFYVIEPYQEVAPNTMYAYAYEYAWKIDRQAPHLLEVFHNVLVRKDLHVRERM